MSDDIELARKFANWSGQWTHELQRVLPDGMSYMPEVVAAHIAQQSAEIERLRGALRPFAHAAVRAHRECPEFPDPLFGSMVGIDDGNEAVRALSEPHEHLSVLNREETQ